MPKKQNTVFIFGSGASKCFGFPLLSKLNYDSFLLLSNEFINCVKKENLIDRKEKLVNKIKEIKKKFKKERNRGLFISSLKNIYLKLEEENKLDIFHFKNSWRSNVKIENDKYLQKEKFSNLVCCWTLIGDIIKTINDTIKLFNNKEEEVTVDDISLRLPSWLPRGLNDISSIYMYYFVRKIIVKKNNKMLKMNFKNFWYKNIFHFFDYQNIFFINFNYDTSLLDYLIREMPKNKNMIHKLLHIHGNVKEKGLVNNIRTIKDFNEPVDEKYDSPIRYLSLFLSNKKSQNWTFPNISYKDLEYNSYYNIVHKVVFVGFGFHKANLKGLGLLEDIYLDHASNKILKDINFNVVIVAGKDFDDADNKAKDRIKELFSEFDNEFVEKINSSEEIIETKKVLLIKKNCEDLDASDWTKIEAF